ncbi:MocR-like pyridoxine biosynthesis transcription factor PdxR [Asaia krungthepensis]|uniref:GntR family transcriptional regulator n=1 Tax=Asaia krungthepensis NRIC 0535 TaxID=1307925 RepID=A0ABQ0Q2A1_9PROT|nr:PLP-dependent aminotransferase family protein [Asaia krungthepensis]GBQ87976.1 GntR family transcriptional regulator [Asaia krungthepensis NRIC 0535]
MTGMHPILAPIILDRTGTHTLSEQIALHIEGAITSGALPAGARLPSWRDLATQLGVARGTVRAAYDRLIDRHMLCAAGAAGTRVAERLPTTSPVSPDNRSHGSPDGAAVPTLDEYGPLALFRHQGSRPLAFQMGVPAQDAFPATLWARLHRHGVQVSALQAGAMDPRGLPELRTALASHLALARGLACTPDQILITTGFRSGLAMVLRAIDSVGKQAWVEDPGFPVTRMALESAGVHPVPVAVDDEGIDVAQGRVMAPAAAFALVTPGQQAPMGVSLSPARRKALLDWARESHGWIIEDDYLAELHLDGRAPPALASGEGADRVIHIGTFSKTLAPMIGLGFVVAPPGLVKRLTETAWWLATPPNNAVQIALTRFMREGHYFRHLRRTRQLYTERRALLRDTLQRCDGPLARNAGLSVILPLPSGFDDARLALHAREASLAISPLSAWFAKGSRARSGIVLGVANIRSERVEADCHHLLTLMRSTI